MLSNHLIPFVAPYSSYTTTFYGAFVCLSVHIALTHIVFLFMQLYWRKINQLQPELLLDYSPIDNLRHLFRAILNSVLEDRLSNNSKPPNNSNENCKILGALLWNIKGVWLPISILRGTRTGHSFIIDMDKIHHIFCSADAMNSIPVLQPHQLWA